MPPIDLDDIPIGPPLSLRGAARDDVHLNMRSRELALREYLYETEVQEALEENREVCEVLRLEIDRIHEICSQFEFERDTRNFQLKLLTGKVRGVGYIPQEEYAEIFGPRSRGQREPSEIRFSELPEEIEARFIAWLPGDLGGGKRKRGDRPERTETRSPSSPPSSTSTCSLPTRDEDTRKCSTWSLPSLWTAVEPSCSDTEEEMDSKVLSRGRQSSLPSYLPSNYSSPKRRRTASERPISQPSRSIKPSFTFPKSKHSFSPPPEPELNSILAAYAFPRSPASSEQHSEPSASRRRRQALSRSPEPQSNCSAAPSPPQSAVSATASASCESLPGPSPPASELDLPELDKSSDESSEEEDDIEDEAVRDFASYLFYSPELEDIPNLGGEEIWDPTRPDSDMEMGTDSESEIERKVKEEEERERISQQSQDEYVANIVKFSDDRLETERVALTLQSSKRRAMNVGFRQTDWEKLEAVEREQLRRSSARWEMWKDYDHAAFALLL
ncbi:hypothetical protein C8J56DRAFT_254885 [Mycena floridula]|nr:hypothetical protein C8J56DRAFT_254885 [Mycena floridula]